MVVIKKILKYFVHTTLVTSIIGLLLVSGIVYFNLQDLPRIDTQLLTTHEVSKIVDKNDNVIYQVTDKRVSKLNYEQIPELYKNSLIAVEDSDFWTNKGYSVKGILNMIIGTIRSKIDKNYEARGGSTLEQQLIKNVYYDGGRNIDVMKRKIQEIFLARQLVENYSKEDILTFYVNHIEYSEGAHGLGSAMKTYFGKTPEQYNERTPENISELAYLVGLGQAPSGYNLYTNFEEGNERKNVVLSVMRKNNIITDEEYAKSKEYDLRTNLKERHYEAEEQRQKNLKYKVYTDLVKEELKDLGYDLSKVSLTVKTHLDPALFDQITEMSRSRQYFQDTNEEQVAVTVMRHDGVVVGVVGSRHEDDELNRAVQQTRSSGSSMKPFTAYAPLLQYFGNKYTTASQFDTSNYRYPGSNSIMYNYGKAVYGQRSLSYSLKMSLNTVVGRIDDEILGPRRMKTFLNGLGLDVQESYSSVDGIGLNISTVQSAAAYNTLNNAGIYTKPRFVDKIIFSDKSEKTIEPKQHRAMNESVAYAITQVLRGTVVAPYTAQAGAIPQYKGYAGKTGSVAFGDQTPPATYGSGGSDVWYSSYTNKGYAVSVWMGYDVPLEAHQVADYHRGYLHLNRDIQKMLNTNNPNVYSNWERPDTVQEIGNNEFKVLDSSDIDSSVELKVPYLQTDPLNIRTIKLQDNVDLKWKEHLTEQDKKIFELQQTGITEMNVINKKIYEVLR